MAAKTILVTGGAGFIGTNLVKRLLANDDYVIVIDNFITGKKKNLVDFYHWKNFRVLEHDIVNKLPDLNVEQIYNLACPASPPQYQKNPVQTVKTNVLGVINVLELAKKTGARVLQASTSEIYGDPREHPQSESYWGNVNPIGRRSCYDEGKRCAETLFFDYFREYAVDVCLVRIFNTFGPLMDGNDGRVVTNLIIQALQNKPLTIYGDGSQTRSFMYIDDLLAGLLLAMNKSGFSGPINLGNPAEISILTLAQEIIKQTQASSQIEFRPLPTDDPYRRQPDIARAQAELGWQPQVSWVDGLRKTIAYWQQILA